MATAPLVIQYAGVGFALVAPAAGVACEQCGRTIGENARRYRSRKWGPRGDQTIYMHQKCLLGQIDPSIWDIK